MSSALTQLHESIAAGDHYSAHQKARTTATRLLAPPRRGPAPTPDANGFLPFDTKAQEAATLLYEGAVALLEKGQTGSGVDLAGYLCDVWKARGVACGAEERGEFFVQRGMVSESLRDSCWPSGTGYRAAELPTASSLRRTRLSRSPVGKQGRRVWIWRWCMLSWSALEMLASLLGD